MSDRENNFQKDLQELEDIVEWFESGDVDLDEALAKFEHGMELADKLKTRLDTMENKVKEIKQRFAQEPEENVLGDDSTDA